MGGGQFYRSFIIRVDQLFYYTELVKEIHFSILVFLPLQLFFVTT